MWLLFALFPGHAESQWIHLYCAYINKLFNAENINIAFMKQCCYFHVQLFLYVFKDRFDIQRISCWKKIFKGQSILKEQNTLFLNVNYIIELNFLT